MLKIYEGTDTTTLYFGIVILWLLRIEMNINKLLNKPDVTIELKSNSSKDLTDVYTN